MSREESIKDNVIQFSDIHKEESEHDDDRYCCLIRGNVERDESFYKKINEIYEKAKRENEARWGETTEEHNADLICLIQMDKLKDMTFKEQLVYWKNRIFKKNK